MFTSFYASCTFGFIAMFIGHPRKSQLFLSDSTTLLMVKYWQTKKKYSTVKTNKKQYLSILPWYSSSFLQTFCSVSLFFKLYEKETLHLDILPVFLCIQYMYCVLIEIVDFLIKVSCYLTVKVCILSNRIWLISLDTHIAFQKISYKYLEMILGVFMQVIQQTKSGTLFLSRVNYTCYVYRLCGILQAMRHYLLHLYRIRCCRYAISISLFTN